MQTYLLSHPSIHGNPTAGSPLASFQDWRELPSIILFTSKVLFLHCKTDHISLPFSRWISTFFRMIKFWSWPEISPASSEVHNSAIQKCLWSCKYSRLAHISPPLIMTCLLPGRFFHSPSLATWECLFIFQVLLQAVTLHETFPGLFYPPWIIPFFIYDPAMSPHTAIFKSIISNCPLFTHDSLSYSLYPPRRQKLCLIYSWGAWKKAH